MKELQAIGLKIEALSTKAQPLARIVDTQAPNSSAWKLAATELVTMTKESLDLARALDDQNILEVAQSAAATVRTQCPVEAAAVGL